MAGREKYPTAVVIKAIQKARGIKAVAAKLLKCDRHTVDNYIKRHPTVARAYQEQRETLVDLAEGKLITKVDADEWPAIKFVLVTLGKNRGYTERREVTGAEGGPLQTEDVGLTDAKRIERLAAILDAARARRDGPAD